MKKYPSCGVARLDVGLARIEAIFARPVADLVEAERSVAAVQEDIDAAQSWLTEARGRVSMSTFEISYSPDAARAGFGETIKASLNDMSSFFGQSLALLIVLVAALLPWLVLGGGVVFAVRWLRRRFRKEDE